MIRFLDVGFSEQINNVLAFDFIEVVDETNELVYSNSKFIIHEILQRFLCEKVMGCTFEGFGLFS